MRRRDVVPFLGALLFVVPQVSAQEATSSGDTNHVVYLEAHPSFADIEAQNRKQEEAIAANVALGTELDRLEGQSGPMHATQRSAIATYREDLSYRPHKMEDVAKARYFQVTTYRVKVGRTPDYVAYVKQLNAAREKAQVADVHTAVYQVVTGAPIATFYSISTNRSLSEWDDFAKATAARNKAVDEALGGDSVVRQRSQMAEQIYTTISSTLYSVNRALSRPTAEFAALDPGFWSPKASGKALAVKKEEKK
jgi:hypothetical protein